MGATALLPGVQARGQTAELLDVRVIELAHRQGWTNSCFGDAELIAAGHHPAQMPDVVLARLTQAGRDARGWLGKHAVPDGWQLVEADQVIVLDRV